MLIYTIFVETSPEKHQRGHYSSRTQINAGGETGPLFESPPRPLLKSGLQPLGRYGTHQETIGMRHEQIYTPTQDWNGLAWGGVII